MKEVVIAGASRTPMGGFQGELGTLDAPTLGGAAIQSAMKAAGVETVDEVLMGCVLPAGQGQAPARQAGSKVGHVSIMAPIVLRDVNVFEKKYQVGQGTYGSVFVGQDKVSNEIVALKRINTKQEENGFPITALREVKILKALRHKNIVTLKEIVTSKGMLPQPLDLVLS